MALSGRQFNSDAVRGFQSSEPSKADRCFPANFGLLIMFDVLSMDISDLLILILFVGGICLVGWAIAMFLTR